MEAKIGMIVRSAAGRDKGRFMAVVSTENGFVYLADGKERKLSSPKKKNIKHVTFTKTSVDIDGMTDKGLRRLLCEFTGEEE